MAPTSPSPTATRSSCKPDAILSPDRYLWGKTMYSMGSKPILDQNGQPVR